jgi:hypothetical protein
VRGAWLHFGLADECPQAGVSADPALLEKERHKRG